VSVQSAIEAYFEQYDILPIYQNQETLFAWMNANGKPITWEDFVEQWQSMTICADCGHCVAYLPYCDNCNP
jgi:hypothetical protein